MKFSFKFLVFYVALSIFLPGFVGADGKHQRDRYQKPGADIRIDQPLSILAEPFTRQDVTIDFRLGIPRGELLLRLNPSQGIELVGSQTQWRFDLNRDRVSIPLSFLSTSEATQQLSFYAEISDEFGTQSRVLSVAVLSPSAISQPFSAQKATRGESTVIFAAEEKIDVSDP